MHIVGTILLIQAEKQGFTIANILPFVLIFAVFYLLLIRPQAKRQKQKQLMLKALKKGDKVLTVGGLYGTIEGIKDKDEVVVIKISDNVKVKVARSAISNLTEEKK